MEVYFFGIPTTIHAQRKRRGKCPRRCHYLLESGAEEVLWSHLTAHGPTILWVVSVPSLVTRIRRTYLWDAVNSKNCRLPTTDYPALSIAQRNPAGRRHVTDYLRSCHINRVLRHDASRLRVSVAIVPRSNPIGSSPGMPYRPSECSRLSAM